MKIISGTVVSYTIVIIMPNEHGDDKLRQHSSEIKSKAVPRIRY